MCDEQPNTNVRIKQNFRMCMLRKTIYIQASNKQKPPDSDAMCVIWTKLGKETTHDVNGKKTKYNKKHTKHRQRDRPLIVLARKEKKKRRKMRSVRQYCHVIRQGERVTILNDIAHSHDD